ncbi:MAG TPA: hypothetical protein VFH91_02030 [Pyrinomonadaceae bacterium]|nr:hypothetical protein [Pyrinomonadaceae bacterium]
MGSLIYNIPASKIDLYRGYEVIIRSSNAAELAVSLSRCDPAQVRFIQLLSTPADTSPLEGSFYSLPVDIHLTDPANEYIKLYDYASLLDSHPLRVSIEVAAGFSKAVKLAVSLNFSVKLEADQPGPDLIAELASVLDLYLHRGSVRQPIEFFHSLLLSFCRDEPASLWQIMEEDPSQVCYVTDDGEETISKRFIDQKELQPLRYAELFQRQGSSSMECYTCDFYDRCRGYFKWPDIEYDCAGVKKIFANLESSAKELQEDLAAYRAMEVEMQS